jgi:tRNA dimethylallyltransferase
MAQEAIRDIHTRNKLPLLVGGTGQYVRAVTEGWRPPEVVPDKRLRGVLDKIEEERGKYWLHAALRRLDSVAADKIDARNVRRTIRALEVIFTSGRKFSEQRSQRASPFSLPTIGLTRPRPELYARIDERIESMFENGLIEEVRRLLEQGYSEDLPSMSAIGYRECIRVVKGQWTEEQAIIEMRRATRIFVRRQANWFKLSDSNIHWFDAGDPNVEEQVRQTIQQGLKS